MIGSDVGCPLEFAELEAGYVRDLPRRAQSAQCNSLIEVNAIEGSSPRDDKSGCHLR